MLFVKILLFEHNAVKTPLEQYSTHLFTFWIICLILLKMYSDETKRKLENIIRGSLIEGDSDHCTAVRNFLCTSFSTSTTVKRDFES